MHTLGFPQNQFCVLQLDQICISFDEGKTTMNFVEAALLIQGSACVYSKKVGAPGHGTGCFRGQQDQGPVCCGAGGRLTPPLTCLASPPVSFRIPQHLLTLNRSLDLNVQGLLLNTQQRPGEPLRQRIMQPTAPAPRLRACCGVREAGGRVHRGEPVFREHPQEGRQRWSRRQCPG